LLPGYAIEVVWRMSELSLRARGERFGAAPPDGDGLLLDRLLPVFDATRIEHRVIDGGPDEVYEATRQADFIRAWKGSPAVRVLFALRSAFERTASLLLRRPPTPPAEVASMRLADMPPHGEWVVLGEARPHEIAFGVIGRFWSGETIWEQIDAAGFVGFERPGTAKIACNFSLRPYGAGRTLVSYETRTRAGDETARRGFMRYWRPLSPFIGIVMRSQLGVIDEQAAENRLRRTPH
jgi:hypothetical protein